ncbi:DUF5681 domain-containing protein [Paraburkholderia bannensis]|uniref:DUF5681 domain-containing protein n=1 Tax=Paraburkholderia bannensis TaxID=765414 RepID=UPI0005A6F606|nr:hypothetical protein [Paraburkholderia bannensis]
MSTENSNGTAKRKPRGKPFAAGQSGNPGGRPKRTAEELDLIAACKDRTPAALAVIESIMMEGENERNRLAAAQSIIERGYGKPTEKIEHTGKDGGDIVTQIVLTSLA